MFGFLNTAESSNQERFPCPKHQTHFQCTFQCIVSRPLQQLMLLCLFRLHWIFLFCACGFRLVLSLEQTHIDPTQSCPAKYPVWSACTFVLDRELCSYFWGLKMGTFSYLFPFKSLISDSDHLNNVSTPTLAPFVVGHRWQLGEGWKGNRLNTHAERKKNA